MFAGTGVFTMPHFTAVQLIVIAIIAILVIIPAAMILRRMGFSGWWAIFAPISPLNILGLWVIAFVKWPVETPIKS